MLPIGKISLLINAYQKIKSFVVEPKKDENDNRTIKERFNSKRVLSVLIIALTGAIANHFGILADLMQWIEFASGVVNGLE